MEQQAGNAGDQSQNVASTLIGDQMVVRSQGTVNLAATQAAATGEDGTLLVLAKDIKDIKDKEVSNTTQQTSTCQSQSSGISIGSNSALITSTVALDNTVTQGFVANICKSLKVPIVRHGYTVSNGAMHTMIQTRECYETI